MGGAHLESLIRVLMTKHTQSLKLNILYLIHMQSYKCVQQDRLCFFFPKERLKINFIKKKLLKAILLRKTQCVVS